MALHFPLKVNNETIGVFEAVRSGETGDPGVYIYRVAIKGSRTVEFTINHRYDDGAWELVRRSLAYTEGQAL